MDKKPIGVIGIILLIISLIAGLFFGPRSQAKRYAKQIVVEPETTYRGHANRSSARVERDGDIYKVSFTYKLYIGTSYQGKTVRTVEAPRKIGGLIFFLVTFPLSVGAIIIAREEIVEMFNDFSTTWQNRKNH